MRASRLLRILLLLQNRGRLTSAQLAGELEVARRTILRDVDALSEAGLPIVVVQGNQGGIELGFNYRTRLTGLAADEAEALALILANPTPELAALGMAGAADRARVKLLESFPDAVRAKIKAANRRFNFTPSPVEAPDPRLAAMAQAIRDARIVRLRARSKRPQEIRPVALICSQREWRVVDARAAIAPIALSEWGDINVSAREFGPEPGGGAPDGVSKAV